MLPNRAEMDDGPPCGGPSENMVRRGSPLVLEERRRAPRSRLCAALPAPGQLNGWRGFQQRAPRA
jgi:hypothetical protein